MHGDGSAISSPATERAALLDRDLCLSRSSLQVGHEPTGAGGCRLENALDARRLDITAVLAVPRWKAGHGRRVCPIKARSALRIGCTTQLWKRRPSGATGSQIGGIDLASVPALFDPSIWRILSAYGANLGVWTPWRAVHSPMAQKSAMGVLAIGDSRGRSTGRPVRAKSRHRTSGRKCSPDTSHQWRLAASLRDSDPNQFRKSRRIDDYPPSDSPERIGEPPLVADSVDPAPTVDRRRI